MDFRLFWTWKVRREPGRPAIAGTLHFEFALTSGTVAFDTPQTVVKDANGTNVSITCTPQEVSFAAQSGQTYQFMPLYFFSSGNDTAILVDDCSPNTALATVNATTPTPTYKIKVS